MGLKSVKTGESKLFLRKPWRFASNIPEITDGFDGVKCFGIDDSHQHAQTRGANAIASQYYTPYMTTLMHVMIYRYFVNIYIKTSGAIYAQSHFSRRLTPCKLIDHEATAQVIVGMTTTSYTDYSEQRSDVVTNDSAA